MSMECFNCLNFTSTLQRMTVDGTSYGNLSNKWKVALYLGGAFGLVAAAVCLVGLAGVGSTVAAYQIILGLRTIVFLQGMITFAFSAAVLIAHRVEQNFHNTFGM